MPRLLPPFLRSYEGSWLYRFFVRDVLWANTWNNLDRYSSFVTLGTVVFTLVWLGTSYISGWVAGVWLIIGAAFFLFVPVDFAAIYFGIVSANERASQLDLLRLASVRSEYLVEALHQAAQTRTWRFLIVMQAIRATLMLTACILAFILGIIGIVFFGVLLFAEPIWRLQMMTAIGLMAGIRGQTTSAQWGTALSLMFGVWVAHGLLVVIPLLLARALPEDSDAWLALTCMVLPAVPVVATFIVMWGHTHLCDWCLRATIRYLDNPAD